MPKRLTADDARQSLSAHAAARGADIFEKFGPSIGWKELLRILEDRASVRYPCKVSFDPAPLQKGECAYAKPNGARPEAGFVIHIHPLFMTRMDQAAHLALYQLVVVNYGPFASSDDAEVFGAAALGISREQDYQGLCEMADLLERRPVSGEVEGIGSTRNVAEMTIHAKQKMRSVVMLLGVKSIQNTAAAGIRGDPSNRHDASIS